MWNGVLFHLGPLAILPVVDQNFSNVRVLLDMDDVELMPGEKMLQVENMTEQLAAKTSTSKFRAKGIGYIASDKEFQKYVYHPEQWVNDSLTRLESLSKQIMAWQPIQANVGTGQITIANGRNLIWTWQRYTQLNRTMQSWLADNPAGFENTGDYLRQNAEQIDRYVQMMRDRWSLF